MDFWERAECYQRTQGAGTKVINAALIITAMIGAWQEGAGMTLYALLLYTIIFPALRGVILSLSGNDPCRRRW